MRVAAAPICLVQMPYAAVERPSLGLSLVQTVLQRAGLEATCVYGSLAFAERIGLGRYRLIDTTPPEALVGEWTFAEAAFGDATPRDPRYFEQIALNVALYGGAVSRAEVIDAITQLRVDACAFVDELATAIIASGAKVVGCTSVFQQHCASLALLRRVRERAPHIVTVMGGANCDGAMGAATHRNFPWVDYVVSGEAEEVVAPLFSALLRHGRSIDPDALPRGVYGPAHRDHPPAEPWRATVWNLSAVPAPCFDDYFETLDAGPLAHVVQPALPLETSRGCWWGEKHHCTFCGLNGGGMKYRSKDPQTVLDELSWLTERHDVRRLIIVDNILDNAYFDSLLPALAQRGGPWPMFFETKSNLRRTQVERLAAAGVRWILPGIETMHDEILRLMDKGSSALTHVALLKWLREKGIRASWNFLVALPGEQDAWYEEMAAWLPSIEHLQPAGQVVPVRYDRFSPYQMRPRDYGLELVTGKHYPSVYPLDAAALAQLAFYFEDAPSHAPPGRDERDRPGLTAVRACLRTWNDRFWQPLPPLCSMRDDGETLHILDTRTCAHERRTTWRGLARQVYLACDAPVSKTALRASMPDAPWEAVEEALEAFAALRLLLARDGRYLALAVAGEVPSLPRYYEFPGGWPDMSTTGAAVDPRERGHTPRHPSPVA